MNRLSLERAMIRFVILAVPRSGSNLLCTLLNSHPGVLCHHEVFNPKGIFTALPLRRGDTTALGTIAQRDRDPLAFLQTVWQTGTGHAGVGFKWTRGQNEQVFDGVVADRSVKKLVLRRRNRVKMYVSEKIAHATDQWEVYSEQDLVQPRPRITADDDELRAHVAANDAFYQDLIARLRRSGQPYLEIYYEDLFDAPEQQRWLEFLEVAHVDQPLQAESIKQNPTDLRDAVANFSELSARLVDTELRAELHDCGM